MRNLGSFITSGTKPGRQAVQPDRAASGTALVALSASAHDRKALAIVARDQLLDLRLAESQTEAWELVNQLRAPVILCDSDWPSSPWHIVVRAFASSPQRPCVILASRVADEHVWQELVRCGGHDLVAKPLRLQDLSCALKLAISYWTNSRATGAR